MIQSPQFSSHAQQQAVLGCAAVLDPEKFPRRAALQRARAKAHPAPTGNNLLAMQRAERHRLAPIVAEMAKTMTISAIGDSLKKSRRLLERIAEEGGFTFVKGKPGTKSLRKVVDEFLQESTDG